MANQLSTSFRSAFNAGCSVNEEVAILENDVLDVTAWINAAIDGKINKCAGRLAKQEIGVLLKEDISKVDVSGLDKRKLAKLHLNREEQKPRKEREK